MNNIFPSTAAIFLFIAPAFAELSLPVELDFQDETLFPVGPLRSNGELMIYVEPEASASGMEITEDPNDAKNHLLVIRSNGKSLTNRLKLFLPEMSQPFEYQFRCKVEGEAPGTRSLLTFYMKDQWDKPARIVIPYMEGNLLHGVVGGKFQSVQKSLSDWKTIKVAVSTDGKASTPDTYSLFVDEAEVLSEIPMEGDFDQPLSIAEIALDFDSPEDVTKVQFFIDDIQIGSPTIKSN